MLTILAILVPLAVIQSLFGVGLLLFGTPALMLLGHSFSDTILTLLPASVTVSFLQCVSEPKIQSGFVRSFVVWSLTPLIVTLSIVLYFEQSIDLTIFVALALALYILLRLLPFDFRQTPALATKYEPQSFMLMGIVQGVSNLGGGLLIIIASLYNETKAGIRKYVSVCYLGFALVQLGVLAVFRAESFGPQQIFFAAAGGIVYFSAGRLIYSKLNDLIFSHIFTGLAGAFLVLLMLRVFELL